MVLKEKCKIVLDVGIGQGVKWQGKEAQIVENRIRTCHSQTILLYIPEEKEYISVSGDDLLMENPDLVIWDGYMEIK